MFLRDRVIIAAPRSRIVLRHGSKIHSEIFLRIETSNQRKFRVTKMLQFMNIVRQMFAV